MAGGQVGVFKYDIWWQLGEGDLQQILNQVWHNICTISYLPLNVFLI